MICTGRKFGITSIRKNTLESLTLFMQILMLGDQLSVMQRSCAISREVNINTSAFFVLCSFQTSGRNGTCMRDGFENQRGEETYSSKEYRREI